MPAKRSLYIIWFLCALVFTDISSKAQSPSGAVQRYWSTGVYDSSAGAYLLDMIWEEYWDTYAIISLTGVVDVYSASPPYD